MRDQAYPTSTPSSLPKSRMGLDPDISRINFGDHVRPRPRPSPASTSVPRLSTDVVAKVKDIERDFVRAVRMAEADGNRQLASFLAQLRIDTLSMIRAKDE